MTKKTKMVSYLCFADVAELADAIDLGSIVNRRAGSIPVIRIFFATCQRMLLYIAAFIYTNGP